MLGLLGFASLAAASLLVWLLPRHHPCRRDVTRTNAQVLRSATVMYVSENPGRCPRSGELTGGECIDPSWSTVDAWGRPFEIQCVHGENVVRSAGPDGVLGTGDDID